ncbi:MAG: Efflux transporter, RND family, MFP subunit [Parcubacteria group bacterium GW2011_GWC1_35_8]|nr:MAG: Efflux transporter, RND family, MFP subunit [Parcubacteria group bacterium GW2011_GWC1_35_8]
MGNFTIKIKSYALAHKIISTTILIVILFLGSWAYGKITGTAGETRYITAKVEKGSIIASISGSGQVSALNQIDIKAKASGDIVYIKAQDGQKISAWGLIAQIDDKDVQKSIRDAEINLESAKIAFEKFKIQNSEENMNADLAKAYDDGFNTVSNVFLDLPEIMTGMNDMFFKSVSATGQWNIDWYEAQAGNENSEKTKIYKQKLIDSYDVALKAYDINFDNYKATSRTTNNTTIENLIIQTYDTTKLVSDLIKNANNYIDFVNDLLQENYYTTPATITTHKSILSGYTSKTNTHLLSLLSIKTSIKDYKDAFLNGDLDTQSQILSLKQKENSLQDLKDKLPDYYIRAPFAGTISVINIKKGDSVSSSTVVATLVTEKQMAEISLNEVDVAKIKIGQKSTLAFDAIPDLTISGVITEIDSVGTVSQGVVTYNVKISFDTQDERIKPGMSVSAEIIINEKQNVLVVPNSAVKSLPANSGAGQKGENYIEILQILENKITKIKVRIGISNDTKTEIISGIKEGDEIITRTILSSIIKTTTAPSLFGSPATTNNRAR